MKKAFIITFSIVLILSGFYFFFLTYISNQNLYFTTLLLKEAGHIVGPNTTILSSMLAFKVVLFASFFITFTAGLVIAFTIAIIVSIIFITRDSFFKIVKMLLPIIISVTLVVTTFYIYDKKNVFLKIRDTFLLSNTLGETINNFYYRYTLHAAETLQSPIRKHTKPCWIDPKIKENSKLKKILFKYGWLATNKKINNALIIKKNFKSEFDFIYNNKLLFRTSIEKFIDTPEKYLSLYSKKTDSRQFLRLLSSIGLMPGILILIFFFIYSIFFIAFRKSRKANLIASCITPLLLISLFVFLTPEILKKPNKADTENMLFSTKPRDRIQALRIIYMENYDIENLPHITSELIKGKAVEKYWLANTLGMKNSKENIKTLKILIKDDSMNVRCAAINALSKIDSSKNSLKLFKQIIKNSNSNKNQNNNQWYVQFYAYNAYKKWIITNNSF
ncbi:MAG: HEAT repeat domain-containing protein [Desulfobacteraceae bacterium]|nr:HEAT repeat domain-containing protein [Desulfobacteraceae bacterium]